MIKQYQLMLSTITLCTSLQISAHTVDFITDADTAFSNTQKEAIGRIAAEYLVKNPGFLITATQKLEDQLRESNLAELNSAVMENRDALLNDNTTPSWGPKKADVAVILFSDYQCIFCAKLTPVLEQIIKKSANTRFIFKEWPIFADRWSASGIAAQTGLRLWQQKGAEAYLTYHNGIFATGHNEGKLTLDDINKEAGPLRSDSETMKMAENALARNKALAEKLRLTGTPALIIMPVNNPQMETITVFTGLTDEKSIMEAVSLARGLQVNVPNGNGV